MTSMRSKLNSKTAIDYSFKSYFAFIKVRQNIISKAHKRVKVNLSEINPERSNFENHSKTLKKRN